MEKDSFLTIFYLCHDNLLKISFACVLSVSLVASDCMGPHEACQVSLSMGFSRQEYWSGLPCPPPGYLPNPGIKLVFPAVQADALPSEPPGKPKNTAVGSLSLLQRIFLAQKSKQGPLHCRRVLYQLSYRGSPVLLLF